MVAVEVLILVCNMVKAAVMADTPIFAGTILIVALAAFVGLPMALVTLMAAPFASAIVAVAAVVAEAAILTAKAAILAAKAAILAAKAAILAAVIFNALSTIALEMQAMVALAMVLASVIMALVMAVVSSVASEVPIVVTMIVAVWKTSNVVVVVVTELRDDVES